LPKFKTIEFIMQLKLNSLRFQRFGPCSAPWIEP